MSKPLPPKVKPASQFDLLTLLKAVAGSVGGGIVGYFIFTFLHARGLYAFMLPGVMVGLGCLLLAKSRSIICSAIGGVCALVTGVVSEYHTNWFVDDEQVDRGIAFFLTHIHESRGGIALIAILLGIAAGAFIARRPF